MIALACHFSLLLLFLCHPLSPPHSFGILPTCSNRNDQRRLLRADYACLFPALSYKGGDVSGAPTKTLQTSCSPACMEGRKPGQDMPNIHAMGQWLMSKACMAELPHVSTGASCYIEV